MFQKSVRIVLAAIPLAAVLAMMTTVGCSPASEPIQIVSVSDVGSVSQITLKNVGVEPVASLTAALEIVFVSPNGHAMGVVTPLAFDDVTPSSPLQPGRTTAITLIWALVTGHAYPLTINATLQDGTNFVYTKSIHTGEPPPLPTGGWAAIGIGIAALVLIAVIGTGAPGLAGALVLILRRRRTKA
jgi:hypothetical protein